jgi:hypothetical protein
VEKYGKDSPLLDLRDSASGSTPLMYAAIENKIVLMGRFIEMGCSHQLQNKVSI